MATSIVEGALLRRVVIEEVERALEPVLAVFGDIRDNRGASSSDGLLVGSNMLNLFMVDKQTAPRLVAKSKAPESILIGDPTRRRRWRTTEKLFTARGSRS